MARKDFISSLRLAPLCVAIILLVLVCSAAALAQREDYESLRKRAFQLYDDHNLIEALPLLEKLATAKPSDAQALERLGFALIANAATLADADARKKIRVRARTILLRSKELGNDSEFLKMMLNSLPADGSEVAFSNRKEIDEAMKEGEAAFVKGDDEKALAAYRRALTLDPNLYEAALFIGDVYFKKGEMAKAGEWFGRAVLINPDRETAYRYWGDALIRERKLDEARTKFIEAIIAEPYNRTAWLGLLQWSRVRQVLLSHPRVDIPGSVVSEGGKVTINVDPTSLESSDGSRHWMVYGLARAAWQAGRFAKEYPNEKTYRHSLREEAEALKMVAEAASKEIKSGKLKQPNPSVANVVRLNDEGLLEAYVLFARANEGIAKDYEAYRKANRDKLRRYLSEYVAPAGK